MQIRKILVNILLGLSVITGLILPWLLFYAIYSARKNELERIRQMQTAKKLLVERKKYDPYKTVFSLDGDTEHETLERMTRFKWQSFIDDTKEKEVGFFKKFYNSLIGVENPESKSSVIIRESYEKQKNAIENNEGGKYDKNALQFLSDVYELLKSSFGRFLYEEGRKTLDGEKEKFTDTPKGNISERIRRRAHKLKATTRHDKPTIELPKDKKQKLAQEIKPLLKDKDDKGKDEAGRHNRREARFI